MTNGFGQTSDLAFSVESEKVVEVGSGVRADNGGHAFAEVTPEACSEDYYVGIDF